MVGAVGDSASPLALQFDIENLACALTIAQVADTCAEPLSPVSQQGPDPTNCHNLNSSHSTHPTMPGTYWVHLGRDQSDVLPQHSWRVHCSCVLLLRR